MQIKLRKGETKIFVKFENGNFLNNLYCSDISLKSDNKKYIKMSFHDIINSRIKTNSNDDLAELEENIDSVKTIDFSDSYISKKLNYHINHGELVIVTLKTEQSIKFSAKVEFKNSSDFSLVKVLNDPID